MNSGVFLRLVLFITLQFLATARADEILPTRPLEGRTEERAELRGLPKEILTPVDQFTTESTVGGYVFHGTPTLTAAESILKNGFYASAISDTRFNFHGGWGLFTTPLSGWSMGYAVKQDFDGPLYNGMLFGLPVVQDKRLNILDLTKNQNHSYMGELKRGEDLIGLYKKLAYHGIDVVISFAPRKGKIVSFLNTSAYRAPKTVPEMMAGLRGVIENRGVSPISRGNAIVLYKHARENYRKEYGDQIPEIDEKKILTNIIELFYHPPMEARNDSQVIRYTNENYQEEALDYLHNVMGDSEHPEEGKPLFLKKWNDRETIDKIMEVYVDGIRLKIDSAERPLYEAPKLSEKILGKLIELSQKENNDVLRVFERRVQRYPEEGLALIDAILNSESEPLINGRFQRIFEDFSVPEGVFKKIITFLQSANTKEQKKAVILLLSLPVPTEYRVEIFKALLDCYWNTTDSNVRGWSLSVFERVTPQNDSSSFDELMNKIDPPSPWFKNWKKQKKAPEDFEKYKYSFVRSMSEFRNLSVPQIERAFVFFEKMITSAVSDNHSYEQVVENAANLIKNNGFSNLPEKLKDRIISFFCKVFHEFPKRRNTYHSINPGFAALKELGIDHPMLDKVFSEIGEAKDYAELASAVKTHRPNVIAIMTSWLTRLPKGGMPVGHVQQYGMRALGEIAATLPQGSEQREAIRKSIEACKRNDYPDYHKDREFEHVKQAALSRALGEKTQDLLRIEHQIDCMREHLIQKSQAEAMLGEGAM